MKKTDISIGLNKLYNGLQHDLVPVDHNHRELLGKLSPVLRGPIYQLADRIDRATELVMKNKLKNI